MSEDTNPRTQDLVRRMFRLLERQAEAMLRSYGDGPPAGTTGTAARRRRRAQKRASVA